MRVKLYVQRGIASSRPWIHFTFDEIVDQASLAPHFSIDPPVQGSFVTSNGQATFLPTQGLQPGKDYQITLRAGVISTAGRILKQDVHWQIQVRVPRVISLWPQDTPPWNLY